jgi:hypothetical protein
MKHLPPEEPEAVESPPVPTANMLLTEKKAYRHVVKVKPPLDDVLSQHPSPPVGKRLFALRLGDGNKIVKPDGGLVAFETKVDGRKLRDRIAKGYGVVSFVTKGPDHPRVVERQT